MWLTAEIVLRLNEIVLRGTEEQPGVRGGTNLEAALNRPVARYRYEDVRSIPHLAAYYAEAITGKHVFRGGNKRTSLAAAGAFMNLNGRDIEASIPPVSQGDRFNDEAYSHIIDLSEGKMSPEEFGDWLAMQSVAAEETETG